MQIIKSEKAIEHPMESVLELDPCTTIVEYNEFIPDEVAASPAYDAKDDEIESKLEEIYTLALGNVSIISDEIERVDGRFKARIGEVTATMLSVALGAVREKSQLKMHKDKMSLETTPGTNPHTVNNNLIVTDRNELLKMLLDKKKLNG